jgi:nitrogen fixation NifU-like protein
MYSQRLLDHYQNPRNQGHLADPDLAAEEYNPLCGDRVKIDLSVAEGRISAVAFSGRGCALCLGAASILTEAIKGRSLDELRSLDAEAFLRELESDVRPSRRKCALLPWMAFRRVVFGETEWPD